MHTRLRSAAGLVASLVMALALTEATWAAMCSPDMMAPSVAHASPGHEDGPPPDGPMDGGHADCPFTPAGPAQDCGMATPLPAGITGTPRAPARSVDRSALPVVRPCSPPASVPFHPPRV